MKRLLALAEFWCGRERRQSVIEPLVADWDRELRDAASRSSFTRAGILVRGGLALSLTLVVCSIRYALSLEGRMWIYGAAAFVVAVGASFASETAILGVRAPNDYPLDVLLIAAIRQSAATALAAAMLPALFLLRREPRAGVRLAAGSIALGSVIAAFGVVWVPNLDNSNFLLSADQNERMYQRALANDRAGRYQYPGTAIRERRAGSTPEQRKARYEQFLVQRAQVLANHPVPPPRQLLRRSNAPLLAILFGMIGWSLGGIVRPTLARTMVWWAMAWLVTLAADGRVAFLLRQSGFNRPPSWALPAALLVTALALAYGSSRMHRSTGPPSLA